MAWRPSAYLMEGELDNTVPGRVTGWLRFAGLAERVQLALEGDCHRDIRGTKLRLHGNSSRASLEAEDAMRGFAAIQSGAAGDITAGGPPVDYVPHPYIEWYSDQNGRVVLELDRDQVEVIGQPLPASTSEPTSRARQDQIFSEYVARMSEAAGVPVLVVPAGNPPCSDPRFTHWVLDGDQIVGEAHSVEPKDSRSCLAQVRLYEQPEVTRRTILNKEQLRPKTT